MEHISFEGVDLAELLPRIPDSIKNGLPFGLVKLDTQGIVLEYNMAEGQIAGVDPNWAIGKSFFDEVAVCTKTAAFYGVFMEGVKKGFLNAVFDYTFDSRSQNARVKVQMVMVPDHLGRKNVMILVKRADKPVVIDAVAWPADPMIPTEDSDLRNFKLKAPQTTFQPIPSAATSSALPAAGSPADAQPSIQDIVSAVIAALNAGGNTVPSAPAPVAAAPVAPISPSGPAGGSAAAKPASTSKIKDIFEL